MTEPRPVSHPSTTLQRRLALFAVVAAVASFALTIAVRLVGGHVRWTAWALPPLIAANAGAFSLGALNRWPRLVRVYLFVSFGLAVAIVVTEIFILVHR